MQHGACSMFVYLHVVYFAHMHQLNFTLNFIVNNGLTAWKRVN